MTQPLPKTYDEVQSVQELIDQGFVDMAFRSEEFWYGRCADGGCKNLHILMRRDGLPYEVGATFNCEQLENMLHTARLIARHHHQ